MAQLTRDTPLAFQIELIDGSVVATIGDVENYLSSLAPARRELMTANAFKEPAYLKTATMSFQTALALDGLVMRIKG